MLEPDWRLRCNCREQANVNAQLRCRRYHDTQTISCSPTTVYANTMPRLSSVTGVVVIE